MTLLSLYIFFFNDTATTEIYTLSLHDALPILEAFASCGADLLLAGHLHVGHAGHTAERYQIGNHSALFVQAGTATSTRVRRSEEHTSELQSQSNLVCRLLLEKKKNPP